MNSKIESILKLLICFVTVTFLGSGCHSGTQPVAWNVSVTKTTPASIEVDFIGISPIEKPYWLNDVQPDKYWAPNAKIRQGATKVTTSFQSGNSFVLKETDPIWNDWFNHGATELMIMADLPGVYDNNSTDRRRMFLPLKKKAWNSKNHTLELEIQDEIIRILTPQRPQQ
jgi:hypothetical protein